MLTLRQALQATPWRLLLVIGRQRGLGLSANLHNWSWGWEIRRWGGWEVGSS